MRRPTARLAMVAALIWCGVTRRVRSTAIPLLILAGISLIPTEVGAGSITYNVVNYPSLQNGYTVSGTITTNGNHGTSLPGTDITSWDIKITMGTTTEATFTPTNSVKYSATFDATPTHLTIATSPDDLTFTIQLDVPDYTGHNLGQSAYAYDCLIGTRMSWVRSSSRRPTRLIATAQTVPEPSSAVLAVIGAVAFVAYGLVRHRREQRRQADAEHIPADPVSRTTSSKARSDSPAPSARRPLLAHRSQRRT